MKRFFITPVCALLSMFTLSSCDEEPKSWLDLAKELKTELNTVVDNKTAEAAAPRVKVLNERFQNAGIRVFALNETAILRSADRNEALADELDEIAREIGRIQASKPVTEFAGAVDTDQLLMAIGSAKAEGEMSPEDAKAAGLVYLQNFDIETHKSPPALPGYYGSDALRDALSYVADGSEASLFDKGKPVTEIPAASTGDDAAPSDEEGEEGEEPEAADEEEPAEDE